MTKFSKSKFWINLRNGFYDTLEVFRRESHIVFHDRGVLIIFIVAGVMYPPLYNFIYYNEVVKDLPVAVVDHSLSSESRRFIREVDATPEVKVAYHCTDMEAAKTLFSKRKIHGILYFPEDYAEKLARKEQAYISVYEDMSSFFYYKNVVWASNMVMLGEMQDIQIKRYNAGGIVGESTQQLVKAVPYYDNIFYNPSSGFGAFFLPIVMILILQQTLFFGIGMVAGTIREEDKMFDLIPEHLRGRGIGRVVIGKTMCYFFIYSVLVAYILGFIPKVFNMPHIGNIWDIYLFMFPFLLSVIFFSLTFSVLVKNRETGLIMFLFFTVILLFLSGISWPESNLPKFWRYLSYMFPSTFGIQGYIKINSTGATLQQVHYEFVGLWIQTFVYFVTACLEMLGECAVKNYRTRNGVIIEERKTYDF